MSQDKQITAERVATDSGRQYHIGLAKGELADFIIFVGDPKRAEKVASRFDGGLDGVEFDRRNREYVTLTGMHRGLRISVMGTGMGPDNTEMAIVELCQIVDNPTIIRCGSSGGLQDGIELGDLVISVGANRLENTSTHYVSEGFPAVASPEAVMALSQAAAKAGRRWHAGVTATAPGFYGAQGRRVPGFTPRNENIVEELARQGVKNLEMEASCLLTLATFRGFRAGAVCAIYATRKANEFANDSQRSQAEADCIETGLEALHLLADMDAERDDGPLWHPGLRG